MANTSKRNTYAIVQGIYIILMLYRKFELIQIKIELFINF